MSSPSNRLPSAISLERKCRFLFSMLIVVVVPAGFWLYARQTEHLAYDQIATTCRHLVTQIVDHQLATRCRPPADVNKLEEAVNEFRSRWEECWPAHMRTYRYWILDPSASPDKLPDERAAEQLKEFRAHPDKQEDNQLQLAEGLNTYYAAVRASPTCLGCHRRAAPDLEEGGLLAVIRIEVPVEAVADSVHTNRALLLSVALVTVILLMLGSFLILRFVALSRPPGTEGQP